MKVIDWFNDFIMTSSSIIAFNNCILQKKGSMFFLIVSRVHIICWFKKLECQCYLFIYFLTHFIKHIRMNKHRIIIIIIIKRCEEVKLWWEQGTRHPDECFISTTLTPQFITTQNPISYENNKHYIIYFGFYKDEI